MANLQKIRDLCNTHKLSLKELSEKIGLTQTGLQNVLKNNSTSIETLEKIASVLHVPVSYFFEEEIKVSENKDFEALEKRIKELEEQLEDKKKIIELMEFVSINEEFAYYMAKEDDIYNTKEDLIPFKYAHLSIPELDILYKNNLISENIYNESVAIVKSMNEDSPGLQKEYEAFEFKQYLKKRRKSTKKNK